MTDFFLNTEEPTVFVVDRWRNVIEYDYDGKYRQSFPAPQDGRKFVWTISYLEDSLFVGSFNYTENNNLKYRLFNRNNDFNKDFPSIFFTILHEEMFGYQTYILIYFSG